MLSSSQVYKLRAYSAKSAHSDGVKFVYDSSRSVNFLVVLNMDKDKIQLYGANESEYDVIKRDSSRIDEKGMGWDYFHAIDSKGEKCRIVLLAYGDIQKKQASEVDAFGSLSIQYDSYMVIFYLKNNK